MGRFADDEETGRRRREVQSEFWIETGAIARAPSHLFYDRLNTLLEEAGFDRFVEELCQPFYQSSGRPGVPPGVYFRMLLVGYYEAIGSQRGIEWRCQDSLSLRKFLGLSLAEDVPDHSSLTRIRDRLGLATAERVLARRLTDFSNLRAQSAASREHFARAAPNDSRSSVNPHNRSRDAKTTHFNGLLYRTRPRASPFRR